MQRIGSNHGSMLFSSLFLDDLCVLLFTLSFWTGRGSSSFSMEEEEIEQKPAKTAKGGTRRFTQRRQGAGAQRLGVTSCFAASRLGVEFFG